jgi:hypothetical protein
VGKYHDKLATFTEEDAQRFFRDYMADGLKRCQHDQDFPDEPKQLRPGENVKLTEKRGLKMGFLTSSRTSY